MFVAILRAFSFVPCNRVGIHSSIHSRSHRPDLRSVRSGGPEPSTPGGIHPMSNDGRNEAGLPSLLPISAGKDIITAPSPYLSY
jgi:hypothetical protein